MNHPFKNTIEALAIYDLGLEERQRLWDTAQSEADVDAADAAEKSALTMVQYAFYEDTKHVNSREHCKLADIGFMRLCANGESLTPVVTKMPPIEDRIGGWKK